MNSLLMSTETAAASYVQMFDIHSIYGFLGGKFRPRRMQFLADYFSLSEDTTVLDVGGTLTNWKMLPFLPRLTILNLAKKPSDLPADVEYVRGDACDLSFDDLSFDLVHSNSVIEHVGAWDRQEQMAKEIRRVGRAYYVQTPNYWFPYEPHLLTPMIHWLSPQAQARLIRNFSVWGWCTRPSKDQCNAFIERTRLLRRREMEVLFPEAELLNENFLGLIKSFMAVRR